MSTVQAIQEAIRELSAEELAQVRAFVIGLNSQQEAVHPHNDGGADEALLAIERAKRRQEELDEAIQIQVPKFVGARDGNDAGDTRSVIQPAKIQDRDEWLAAFQHWVDSHRDVTAIADDSRESIYQGRGE